MQSELFGPLVNALDFVLSIFLFIIVHSFVDVLFPLTEHAVDESGSMWAIAVMTLCPPSRARKRRNLALRRPW